MKLKRVFLAFLATLMLFSFASCNNKALTVTEAVREIGVGEEGVDRSSKYDLDERFSYFRLFNPGGQGWLFLNNEEGLLSILFNMKENEDGSVECTITEIGIDTPSAFGPVSTVEGIKKYIGDDIVFTLLIENNVVTSHDLPELL